MNSRIWLTASLAVDVRAAFPFWALAKLALAGAGGGVCMFGARGFGVVPAALSVHCKDGDWPPRDEPLALGKERPLGEGSVDMPRFIEKLKEIGYRGVLTIEREGVDEERQAGDIRKAVALLKKLTRG